MSFLDTINLRENLMKLTITGDLHLTKRAEHPERFAALENILNQMLADHLDTLIIAGDLFDASQHNYAEFETVCANPEYAGIRFYIIPGNHDSDLSQKSIAAGNVRVFTSPEIVRFGPQDYPVLFVPYQKNKTMGEGIARHASELPPDGWALVGHGDYIDGWREPNPYEDGIYMPFIRRERMELRPGQVFLGHIHRQQDRPVHYTGSPCGLDINETGHRRFLVYDLLADRVESRRVETALLYFNETLTILPVEDEIEYLRQQVGKMVAGWNLDPAEGNRVEYRLAVNGWTADKTVLKQEIQALFSSFRYYRGGEPDLSQVNITSDPERNALATSIYAEIAGMEFPSGDHEPDRAQILSEAIRTIYGGK